MGFVVLGIAAVAIIGFGAVVHWWGRRDFSGTDVSAEHRPHLDGKLRPTPKSLEVGELGKTAAANTYDTLL